MAINRDVCYPAKADISVECSERQLSKDSGHSCIDGYYDLFPIFRYRNDIGLAPPIKKLPRKFLEHQVVLVKPCLAGLRG